MYYENLKLILPASNTVYADSSIDNRLTINIACESHNIADLAAWGRFNYHLCVGKRVVVCGVLYVHAELVAGTSL